MKSFAECLKYAMTQSGMTQATLSDRSGCSKAAISQYLSGKNTPSTTKVEALAGALGVHPSFLMDYKSEAKMQPPITFKKITTDAAAKCLGKSSQFIRVGLQRGTLPFGDAVPGTGNRWNYYINPIKFRDYVGAERFNEFFGLTA